MAWAGKLNEVVEIYDVVTERNAFGEDEMNMIKTYDTRAQVIYSGGSRTNINSDMIVPYNKRFVMRIYVPVTETSWIKWNGRFYRVMSIEESREWQEKTVDTQLVTNDNGE